ncbi:MAG: ABC transporter permease [Clostridiales bacterium]|nr:ABC transporter permease [Clostridiales bacterium]
MSERKNNTNHEPLFHLAKRSVIPQWRAWLIRVAAIVLGLAVCGIVAYILSDKLQEGKKTLADFYYCFIKGSFTTNRKIWKFLKNMAILQCISLAVTPAFRMRFWNTGAEGQTLMGVWGAIAVAFYLGGEIPEALLLVLMFVGALLCSAVWAVIPAIFKAKWNTNETLFTLMMNYVAIHIVEYFLVVWVPSGSSSLGKLKYGKLPSFGHDYLVIILIVLLLTLLLYVYLKHSKQGYEISVVGESVRTAQYSGMNVKKVIIRTMVVSGLLCGLAGYLIGAGLDQTVTTESVGGQGFTAIMVSWLANFNPIVMLLTSGLITLLDQGAAQITQDFGVRGAFPDVIIGIILFFIIGSEFFINYQVIFRKGGHAAKEGAK